MMTSEEIRVGRHIKKLRTKIKWAKTILKAIPVGAEYRDVFYRMQRRQCRVGKLLRYLDKAVDGHREGVDTDLEDGPDPTMWDPDSIPGVESRPWQGAVIPLGWIDGWIPRAWNWFHEPLTPTDPEPFCDGYDTEPMDAGEA